MPNQLDLPPVYTVLALVAVGVLSWIGNIVAGIFPAWFVGSLLVVGGIGLIGWSAYLFNEYQTTLIPRKSADALVMDGPFVVSRNPMYLGMVLITLGVGVVMGPLIAYIPAFILAAYLEHNFIQKEEEKLVEAFGAEAQNYIENTPKWIGYGPIKI